jgi:hypothetical protein
MTDGHSLILQLLMAGILANLVSMFVDKHSLYHYLKNNYINELQKEEVIPIDEI